MANNLPVEDQLDQNITDLEERGQALIDYIVGADARTAAANAERDAAIAASNISAAEKAALQARIAAVNTRANALEDKERAAVPGIPPIGGTALDMTYPDVASVTRAAAAYTGPELVDLTAMDATVTVLHTATNNSAAPLHYYVQADGSVANTPPVTGNP